MPPRSPEKKVWKRNSHRRRNRHPRKANLVNHPSEPTRTDAPQSVKSVEMPSQPRSLSSTNNQPGFQLVFHVPHGTIMPESSTPYVAMEPARYPLMTVAPTIPTYYMVNPQLIPSSTTSNSSPVETWPEQPVEQPAEWLIQQLLANMSIQQSQPLWAVEQPQAQAPFQLPIAAMSWQSPQAEAPMQQPQAPLPVQQPEPAPMQALYVPVQLPEAMMPLPEHPETLLPERAVPCANCHREITIYCRFPENECGYGRRCGFLHEMCECEAPYCIKDHDKQKKYCATCNKADPCVGLPPKK